MLNIFNPALLHGISRVSALIHRTSYKSMALAYSLLLLVLPALSTDPAPSGNGVSSSVVPDGVVSVLYS